MIYLVCFMGRDFMAKDYTLCAGDIDRLSGNIQTELEHFRMDRKEIQRIRLSVEECLIKYAEKFGEDVPVTVKCDHRFLEYRVTVTVVSEPMDPLSDSTDELLLMNKLLDTLSFAPTWNYSRGANVIVFSQKPTNNIELLYYLLAVMLGLGGGSLAHAKFPKYCPALCQSYLSPISNVIMGFLASLAVVMVFTSIVTGIGVMDNIRIFKRIGSKMILRFFAILFGCLLFVTALSLLFFPLHSSGKTSVDAAALWQMIVAIVPTNIFTAFSSGNVLQVIFISVFCGIALLSISNKTPHLRIVLEQANHTANKMLSIIIKFMPVVVFISLFNLTALQNFPDLTGIYKYLLLMVLCCIAMILFSVARVCIRNRISPLLLLKKLSPTMFIAFLTASSSATYTTNVEICKRRLGIDKSIVNIGIPLGSIVFKPCTVFQPICGCLCFANLYGIDISVSQLLVLMLTVLLLAIAEPPVPGILVSCFTLLFNQLGVPLESLSFILALECILDRLGTCTNILALQTELIQSSRSMGLLNQEILRKK